MSHPTSNEDPLAIGASLKVREPRTEIEEYIQGRILSGQWPAGHKLPSEAALGEQFGASRTAIREAIRRLQGRGLLHTVNGSGSYVANAQLDGVYDALNAYSLLSNDEQSFNDLLELRMAIEGDAAAKVAALKRPSDWDAIEQKLTAMKAANLLEEFSILDIDFHMEILRVSCNELFLALGTALRDRYVRFAIDSYRVAGDVRRKTMEEHQAIFDAIRSGEPTLAREAAKLHVARAKTRWATELGKNSL